MKIKFLFLVLFVLTVNIYGQDLFVNISLTEAETLKNGGILSRTLKNKKKLLINTKLEETKKLNSSLTGFKPNYISEVISIKRITKEMDLELILEKLEAELSSLNNFVSIPYFSQKWNKTYNLYDWIKIDSLSSFPNGFTADVTQSMKPFGEMLVQYNLTRSDNSLYFSSENLSSISYNGVKAVKQGRMKWSLSVFVFKNELVFYGVGAAKAFDMFGALRSRLEPSFVGRANAFFLYINKKLF